MRKQHNSVRVLKGSVFPSSLLGAQTIEPTLLHPQSWFYWTELTPVASNMTMAPT